MDYQPPIIKVNSHEMKTQREKMTASLRHFSNTVLTSRRESSEQAQLKQVNSLPWQRERLTQLEERKKQQQQNKILYIRHAHAIKPSYNKTAADRSFDLPMLSGADRRFRGLPQRPRRRSCESDLFGGISRLDPNLFTLFEIVKLLHLYFR